MTQIEHHVRDNPTVLTTTQKVTQAINALQSTNDLAVVYNGEGEYAGVITAEHIFRVSKTTPETKVGSILTKAPKITPTATVEKVSQLLLENDTKILPVFNEAEDDVLGIIHVNDILQELKALQDVSAEKIMTKDVTTISPETTVGQAMATLRDLSVSRVPVTNENGLQGILSVYDIAHRVLKPESSIGKHDIAPVKKSKLDVEAGSIMNKDLITATPGTNASTLIDLIRKNDVGSVLITDNKDLHGIITRRDLLEHYIALFPENDETVRITIASKVEDLDRETLLAEIKAFVKKFKNSIGPGHITLHVKQHKEQLRGKPLLFGRLRVRCRKTDQNIRGDGFGEALLANKLLRTLRTRILKYHQDQHQSSTTEYIDHFDAPSL